MITQVCKDIQCLGRTVKENNYWYNFKIESTFAQYSLLLSKITFFNLVHSVSLTANIYSPFCCEIAPYLIFLNIHVFMQTIIFMFNVLHYDEIHQV